MNWIVLLLIFLAAWLTYRATRSVLWTAIATVVAFVLMPLVTDQAAMLFTDRVPENPGNAAVSNTSTSRCACGG